MQEASVRVTRSKDKDEYWGYWFICECGYEYNTEEATFCGGCGRKMIEYEILKRGTWISSTLDSIQFCCSNCLAKLPTLPFTRFCSYCGAKMDY